MTSGGVGVGVGFSFGTGGGSPRVGATRSGFDWRCGVGVGDGLGVVGCVLRGRFWLDATAIKPQIKNKTAQILLMSYEALREPCNRGRERWGKQCR